MVPRAAGDGGLSQRGRRQVLAALISEGFLSRLGFGVAAFALPLYARRLGLSFAEISLLVSLNVVVGMLLKPAAGRFADRRGHRGVAVAGLGVRSVMCFLFGVASAPWQLFLLQSLRGVGKSLRDPALIALLAAHGGKQRIATTFAWYQTAKGAANSLGHAVAGLLLTFTAGSYGVTFAIAAGLSALPCLILPVLIPRTASSPSSPAARPAARGAAAPAAGESPRRFALAPFVGFGFIISASSRMLRRMMPLLLVEYAGLEEAAAGSIYLLASSATLLATPAFGWLHDHVSPKPVLLLRSALNAASSLLYIASPTYPGIAVAKVLDKSGTAAFRPAWGAMMARVSAADPALRAGRIGVMSAGEDAGTVLGPILAGVLWTVFGAVPMLAARLALALVAEVYTLWLLRWLERSSRTGDSVAASVVAAGETP